jgi:hypothetical protein
VPIGQIAEECKKNKDKVYLRFAKESVEEVSSDARGDNIARARAAMGTVFGGIVAARSRAWDPVAIGVDQLKPPSILNDHGIQKTNELEYTLAEYSRLHLLATNLLLVGYYHGARVSDCAAVLSTYSPARMARLIPDALGVGQATRYGDMLKASLEVPLRQCAAVPIREELVELKKQLTELLSKQR